jgi:REP element-mobilizing transposase RayT
MARPLRIDVPGGWYHVTARGNERRAIFLDDRDRERFVGLVAELPVRFGVRVHAYVLMSNHWHALVETPTANLSRVIQWVQVSYSVWFNRRHRRSGHLFQGRFKAILFEAEALAWGLSQYVHLNPVRLKRLGLDKASQARSRAGLGDGPTAEVVAARLKRLREYRWSSYRAYAGLTSAPGWLTTAAVLGGTGKRAARQRAYVAETEALVREGHVEAVWERVRGGALLGSERFLEKMQAYLKGNDQEQAGLWQLQGRPTLAVAISAVERLKGQKWERFRDQHGDWGRDLVLYLGRTRCGMTLRELATAAGGVQYGSISAALRRFTKLLTENSELREIHTKIVRQLSNNPM